MRRALGAKQFAVVCDFCPEEAPEVTARAAGWFLPRKDLGQRCPSCVTDADNPKALPRTRKGFRR